MWSDSSLVLLSLADFLVVYTSRSGYIDTFQSVEEGPRTETYLFIRSLKYYEKVQQ